MTHPNTKKLYEVLDECFLVFHPRTKRRVFELFFLNEMSRRTDTHCQQGKKTRGHVPPPRKKTLAKQQPRIVYTVLKKNRDGFFFQRFTLGKPKTFSRTTRQMVFFAEILLFFLFERS